MDDSNSKNEEKINQNIVVKQAEKEIQKQDLQGCPNQRTNLGTASKVLRNDLDSGNQVNKTTIELISELYPPEVVETTKRAIDIMKPIVDSAEFKEITKKSTEIAKLYSDTLETISPSVSKYIEKYYNPQILEKASKVAVETFKVSERSLGSLKLDQYIKAIDDSNLMKAVNKISSEYFLPSKKIEEIIRNNPSVSTVVEGYLSTKKQLSTYADIINKNIEAYSINDKISHLSDMSDSLIPEIYKLYASSANQFSKTDKLFVDEEDCKLVPYIDTTRTKFLLEEKPFIDNLQELFPQLEDREIIDFRNFLAIYPMLGINNKTGELIYNGMKRLLKTDINSSHFYLLKENEYLYRCRKWTEERGRTIDFTLQKMYEAPVEKVAMARFNPAGVNHLYMASTWQTAKHEARATRTRIKFTMLKAKVKENSYFLNLTKGQNLVFTECLQPKCSDNDKVPEVYLISNFLSQCCNKIISDNNLHISGIRYPSVYDESTYSYVLFNKNRDFFKDAVIMTKPII
ncbi:hypothetical protein DYP60_13230 [Sphaerochaeta halotolerans]|uniref:RES domain-containing protein n=1 Tax=Sphaerochaeta halotolerans TaxID=2293840 RepID=A0A372MD61_9SPIR|nr:RES domain-containing protein [Sphaerochaeta halotolerans]RFU93727.1 hypothetical protein DYP60_13230 [Sphaerochaeta halotolerans]